MLYISKSHKAQLNHFSFYDSFDESRTYSILCLVAFVFHPLQNIVCVVLININVTCLSHSLPAISVVFRMTAARVDAWKRFEVE